MNLRTNMKRMTCVALACVGVLVFARASHADLLVSNFGSSTLTRYDSASGALTATYGVGSGLNHPLCTRVGPDGLLYVASEGTNSVMRFNAGNGAFVDSFVAPGSGGLTQPTGLDWGPDGGLYVSSFDGDSVLRYDGTSGAFQSTFVTPGSGALNGADNGMVFGPDGNLYVPSYFGGRVLKYNGTTGAYMGVFAGVARPRVIIFRENDVLISSETANTVRRHDLVTGAFLGNLVSTNIRTPIGMAIDTDGSLYVASSGDNRIVQFNAATGAYVRDFATAAQGVALPAFITVIPVPSPGSAVVLVLGAVALVSRRGRCAAGR